MCTYVDSNYHDGIERTLTVSPFAALNQPLTVTTDSYTAIHTLRGHHRIALITSELNSLLHLYFTSLSTGFYSFVLTTSLTLLYSWMCTPTCRLTNTQPLTGSHRSTVVSFQVSHDLFPSAFDACLRVIHSDLPSLHLNHVDN